MNKKQFVLNFIKRHKIGVLATMSHSKPEAAVVEFGETKDLELIFDTFVTYRKYKNIRHNPNVAFVIGWDEDITVQYEGTATELHGEELGKYKKIYFRKIPDAQKWEKFKETRWFKVVPKWIRCSDLNKWPAKVIEIKF